MENSHKNVTDKIIFRMRAALGADSDLALGKLLGSESRGLVSNWRKNGKVPRGAIATASQLSGKSVEWILTGEYSSAAKGHDTVLEKSVEKYAAGWECKGEEFSDFERRLVGMLRRLSPETRQEYFDAVTTSYFLQMEKEFTEKSNKN